MLYRFNGVSSPPPPFFTSIAFANLANLIDNSWLRHHLAVRHPFANMNLKRFAWFALLAAQAILWAGCTASIWEEGRFARYHEPADKPNLRLFYSSHTRDVLVEYIDVRETDGAAKRRAFWLGPNQERVCERHRPHFVSLSKEKGLVPIPFRAGLPPLPAAAPSEDLYAVVSADGSSFTLYGGRQSLGDYHLPTYADASGRVIQVLLTPPALVADASMVGAVVAFFVAYTYAQSGGTADFGRWWR